MQFILKFVIQRLMYFEHFSVACFILNFEPQIITHTPYCTYINMEDYEWLFNLKYGD
jgi:hypothetical protein